MTFEFDRDIACEGGAMDIPSRWNVGTVPNGGYLMAIAAHAIGQVIDHPDPLTLTGHYLSAVQPGPATVSTQVMRTGRSVTTARAEIRQDDTVRCHFIGSWGRLLDGQESDWSDEPPPAMPPPDQCVARVAIPIELAQRLTIRWPPGADSWMDGIPGEAARMLAWLAFADGRAPDLTSLPLFADALPPAIFARTGPTGWVPTLEMTVQFRRQPAPGPLQARFRTRHVTGSLLEEDGTLWDSQGRLVALSRQLARLGAGSMNQFV